jgi:hypothetical protein
MQMKRSMYLLLGCVISVTHLVHTEIVTIQPKDIEVAQQKEFKDALRQANEEVKSSRNSLLAVERERKGAHTSDAIEQAELKNKEAQESYDKAVAKLRAIQGKPFEKESSTEKSHK